VGVETGPGSSGAKMKKQIAILSIIAWCTHTAFAQTPNLEGAQIENERAQLEKRKRQLEAELRKINGALSISKKPAASSPQLVGRNAAADAAREFSPRDLEKKHAGQSFYVRRDPIDAFYYLYPAVPLDGKGASISFTDDILNSSRSLTVQGYTSWVMFRQFFYPDVTPGGPIALTGVAAAPFVYANGTRSEPMKPTEKSALQFGFDAQAEFAAGGLFSLQNVGVKPYYQTDFRGLASITGVSALWEPYKENWNLGGRYDVAAPKLLGILWRVIGEANFVHVETPGLSNFTAKNDYAFVGGTLQLRTILFENMSSVGPLLCGNIYATSSINYFGNAAGGKPIHDFQAEVGYTLSSQATPSNRLCREAPVDASTIPGKTSISLAYSNGTDKSTLEKREKYLLQLNYQY
jgi:hypothetical protein